MSDIRNRARAAALILSVLVLASCGGGGGGSNSGGGGGGGGAPLTITTSTLPDGVVFTAYSTTVVASGGTAPIKWSVAGFFPLGLDLNQNTGAISGTVQGSVFGDVTFIASDSSNPPRSAQKTIRMTFNWPMSIYTDTLSGGHTNAQYDAIVQSSGFVSPSSWKLLSGSLPPGLQLTSPASTQVEIAGMPTQTGSYPFTLQVQDDANPPQIAKKDFNLVVDSALTITNLKLSDGIQNTPYTNPMGAVNGSAPYSWSAIGLPTGLLMSPTGVIQGTATVQGDYSVTASVTDSSVPPATDTKNYVLSIARQLTIFGNPTQPFQLYDATIGQSFYYTFNSDGGSGVKAWSISSGSLPPGITLLSQYGTLSGIPTQLGSYSFTVQVKDSGTPQQTAQLQVAWKVKPVALALQGSLPWRLPLGVPFKGEVALTGGTPPYQWNLTNGELPTGLTLDPSTGGLSGTPNTLGQFNFFIGASDSASPPQTTSRSYSLSVSAALGRNDMPSKATPAGDGIMNASISPFADPPDSPSPVPDSDYYKILGTAGNVINVSIEAKRTFPNDPLDSVLEITDANGVRLNTCRQPGDTSTAFTSNCMNDDIDLGVIQDSELDVKVPGTAGTQSAVYAHVLDWRGDARPDMMYFLHVTGSVPPLVIGNESKLNACGTGLACYVAFFVTGGTGTITWTLDSGTLPPGLQLSTAGVLTGSATTLGTYNFVLRATDSATPAQSVAKPFSMLIASGPQITTTSLPNAVTGVPYTYQVTMTGGTPPIYWNWGTFDWRVYLQMNSTGLINGTPQYPGSYQFLVQVRDAQNITDSKTFTITIDPGPLQAGDVTLLPGKVNVAYWANSTYPKGGTPNYIWTIASGSTLPPGLVLDPNNGIIQGTPTIAGSYQFNLTITDSGSPAQSKTVMVSVSIAP
jgi:Putative Ig domain